MIFYKTKRATGGDISLLVACFFAPDVGGVTPASCL